MRPRRSAMLAMTLLICFGIVAAEAQATANSGLARGLRKAVRGVRRVRTGRDGAVRAGRDIGVDGSDEDYLVNVERAFRGYTFRELELKNGRGFGDTKGRGFASEAKAYDDAPRNRFSETNRDIGSSRTPYSYNNNDGRVSDSNRNAGTSASRDFGGSPRYYDTARGIDAADRSFQPTRLKDYSKDAAGNTRNGFAGADPSTRNTGLARTEETDSQRWLKILAEFLKTSSEGRELLRARADHLLRVVGTNGDGELPLPLLLVPVPVQGEQCSAKVSSPQPDLQPPNEYLPPDGTTTTTDAPITPDSKHVNPDEEPLGPVLLELFRLTEPRAPLLPPLLLPESPAPTPPAPLPPLSADPPPARLRFSRSLLIRAELTVYYSDYTEPYTVWYDAQSGSSRVDMHGGTSVLYRTVRPGEEVTRVQVRIERYEEEERRRCTRLTTAAVDADRSPPGLPDPEPFSFDGYQQAAAGRLERWTYSLAGQAGELGAARGEALVFRHELLVARLQPDYAVPYKYRVTVDSSILGPEVDWYEHRYVEVREQQPDPRYMSVDVERECDVAERAPAIEHVDPLREFVMTHRDARCDTDFDKFKEAFDVNYEDPVEEAIRKTLLIRSTRFVESANRQGSPALLEVNELSVLLPGERKLLQGLVSGDEEADGAGEPGEVGAPPFSFAGGAPQAEPFPYSAAEVAEIAAQLPSAFNWKRKGAVTHVRNQGFCRTCWAFAVVAAVEGALFLRTGSLVPLSDQQLADCTPGPHTCERGNHVQYPYRRVQERGLAALGKYQRYHYDDPKVEQCRKEDMPVTRISGFVRVDNSSDALKVAIARHGPNVIEVDSGCDGFVYFKAGVLKDLRCNPNARNHAITATGFSKHKLHGNYFIAKNSWGLTGNRGYVHLHAGTNTAGVHTAPSYPLLAASDVTDEAALPALKGEYSDEKSIFKTDKKTYREYLRRQKQYLAKSKAKQKLQKPR